MDSVIDSKFTSERRAVYNICIYVLVCVYTIIEITYYIYDSNEHVLCYFYNHTMCQIICRHSLNKIYTNNMYRIQLK